MNIKLFNIKVKDVFNGFVDKGEDGVFAYGGKLTIRPPYQREFVYDLKQQEAVLHTVLKKFPLNTMYWVKTNTDHPIVDGWEPADTDKFEVLDGQQRTLSVMMFLKHKLQINWNGASYYEDSLPNNLYDDLLDYEFMVYICEGTESEKLEWFKVVNVAGEELTPQELRNSVYTGAWLADAKKHFSKSNCAAKGLSDKYIKGAPIRQELLEKALKGIVEKQKLSKIEDYICPICHKHFEYGQMEGDHKKPWSKGGLTVYDNLQMLCKDCNGQKSAKY